MLHDFPCWQRSSKNDWAFHWVAVTSTPTSSAGSSCVELPATSPSLGTLIRVGNDFLFSGSWWISIFPGAVLAILVLAVNLLGDWLRDALNPKLR